MANPMYRQIAEDLREQIESAKLAPGSQLPTEPDLRELPQDGRVPMSEIFRTAFNQNGTPMRLTVTVCAADRNQFIFDNGQVPAPQYEMGGDGQDSVLAR